MGVQIPQLGLRPVCYYMEKLSHLYASMVGYREVVHVEGLRQEVCLVENRRYLGISEMQHCQLVVTCMVIESCL